MTKKPAKKPTGSPEKGAPSEDKTAKGAARSAPTTKRDPAPPAKASTGKAPSSKAPPAKTPTGKPAAKPAPSESKPSKSSSRPPASRAASEPGVGSKKSAGGKPEPSKSTAAKPATAKGSAEPSPTQPAATKASAGKAGGGTSSKKSPKAAEPAGKAGAKLEGKQAGSKGEPAKGAAAGDAKSKDARVEKSPARPEARPSSKDAKPGAAPASEKSSKASSPEKPPASPQKDAEAGEGEDGKNARKGITIVNKKVTKKPAVRTAPSGFMPPGVPLLGSGVRRKPLIASGPKAAIASNHLDLAEEGAKLKSPFGKKDLTRYRDILLARRAVLYGDVSNMEREALQSSSGSLSNNPQHMADQGTDASEQNISLDIAAADRKLIKEIDDALARIEAGTYGVCELTGKPINVERLEELPWTRYSIEAARMLERQQLRV